MSFFSEYKNAVLILSEEQQVVFFAESKTDRSYFEPLLSILLSQGVNVCYITADKNDPLLLKQTDFLRVFYFRFFLFHVLNKLKSKSVCMTLTELDEHVIKRSPYVKEYIYVFHALVSIFQQYNKNAFTGYDTILCPGPIHNKEILFFSEKYNWRKQKIIPYGYPIVNELRRLESLQTTSAELQILLAPSWHTDCIYNTCFPEVYKVLSDAGYSVTLRFHPEYSKRFAERKKKIIALVKDNPKFSIDNDYDVTKSMKSHDILITDRSGIAFEFALGKRKPVIFVDTKEKIMNAEQVRDNMVSIETGYRNKIGYCLQIGELLEFDNTIKKIQSEQEQWNLKLLQIKDEIIYFDNSMPQTFAQYIKQLSK